MSDTLDTLQKIRNLGIIAHVDAGKTTISERILYYTHKIHHIGEVHHGNTALDFMPEEQERGITISAASTFCSWKEYQLNFIDTPGHVDFTIEVERSLHVLDGAVGVFCGVRGVEPQSETVWRQSESLAIPKIAFINKMDKVGADFEFVLTSLEEKLGADPFLLQIPLYDEEEHFYAIADLIELVKYEFDEDDQGESISTTPLEGDEFVLAEIWREKLIEKLADKDDVFLNVFLSEEETVKPSIHDIKDALRRITLARLGVPTLVGAAVQNIGIQPLLDAIGYYLPAPFEVHKKEHDISFEEGKFKALVFKIIFDGDIPLALIRLYNGKLINGMYIRNINQKTDGQVEQVFRMHADFPEEIDEAFAGEIVAIKGIEGVKTGDTLAMCEEDDLLENISEYTPVISLAFEAKNEEETKILGKALKRYTLEDPTLFLQEESVLGNYLVAGMGELHLEVLKERILREYKIEPRTGNPQVVLCETLVLNEAEELVAPLTSHIIFKNENNEEAEIKITLSPRQRGQGNLVRFSQGICFDDKNLRDVIEKIAYETLSSGSQNGALLQDILVFIEEITWDIEKNSLNSFQVATYQAIKEALSLAKERGQVVTLVPFMSLDVLVPDEELSPCLNLLNTCGAKVDLLYDKAGLKCVVASAPMQELFGFATRIRSVSKGRAHFVMAFKEYNIL